MHGEVVKISGVADMRERPIAQGFEPVGNTPDSFGAYIKSEIAKWGKVMREAGIWAG